MKKAIVTFIMSDTFETIIPDEVYEKGDGKKAIEIVQNQMLKELGYNCTEYDDIEIEFIDEED